RACLRRPCSEPLDTPAADGDNRPETLDPPHSQGAAFITRLIVFGGAFAMAGSLAWADEKIVQLVRTPDRGIQPQALTDAQGRLHLLYFTGSPAAGHLFSVRRASIPDTIS